MMCDIEKWNDLAFSTAWSDPFDKLKKEHWRPMINFIIFYFFLLAGWSMVNEISTVGLVLVASL